MYAVGVDVSKGRSTVAVLRSKSEVVMLPFDETHDVAGLASLVDKLNGLDGEIRIVMEHTGTFYESIAMFLHNARFYVSAVNPLLIKQYGNNTLRKVKTDKLTADMDFVNDLNASQKDFLAGVFACTQRAQWKHKRFRPADSHCASF